MIEVLENSVDASIAVDIKESICDEIDQGRFDVVLDLSRVDFIDSSGMGAIVGAFKHMGTRGTFAVACVTKSVSQVFRMTRMDKVFDVYPTLDEAVAR